MNYKEIKAEFSREILPGVVERYGYKDRPAIEFEWGCFIDDLQREGKISMEEYQQMDSFFGYETDWNNIDLERESHLCILSPISFDELLLTIGANCSEINTLTIREEFETLLEMKTEEARDIFNSNLLNITTKAIREERERTGE